MRYILSVVLLLVAFPVAAKQSDVCKGKETFKLSDGAVVCLLEISENSFTRSRTVDNALDWEKEVPTVRIIAAISGEFSEKWRVTTPRHKQICKTFLPQIQSQFGDTKFRNIVVIMSWDKSQTPKGLYQREDAGYQAAYLTKACRSVQYFGTRIN